MRDTIDMAREANLAKYGNGLREDVPAFINALKAFEALVRADERDKWMERTAILIRGEREACAKVCDDQAQDEPYGHAKFRCANIAAAIRARGETK